jgi:SAM-dependent methyltransferase
VTIVDVTRHETNWESAVADWPRTRGHRVLRAYGDELNARLAEAWLGTGPRPHHLLKTDLFDEAVGEGLFPRLAGLADQVEGVDVSEAVVCAARRRYPELEAQQADVRRLPFDDESFDAIVSFSTLDHFASTAELDLGLAELERVLSPGGRLLVTLDNAGNPLVALRNSLPWRWLASVRLVPCYVGATCGREALDTKLRGLGLDVERRAAVMHVPRVAALGAAALWPRGRSPIPVLLAGERLGGLATRDVTGQFVAALATKPE